MTIGRTRGVKTGRGMRAAPVLVAIATQLTAQRRPR